MILKNSRYAKATLFSPGLNGNIVFPGIRPRTIGPSSGVIEHTVKVGERLDLLARHYYNNDRLWWRIADANPTFVFSGRMVCKEAEGAVILIPKERE